MGAQGQEWDSPLRGGGGDEAEDREGDEGWFIYFYFIQ